MTQSWQNAKFTLWRNDNGGFELRLQVKHLDGRIFTRFRSIAPGEDVRPYAETAFGKVEGSLEAADELEAWKTEA